MKKKKLKQLIVYISKPLDYPSSLYLEIKEYLENKNFIVTTFEGEGYTPEKLHEADVVFFLTNDFDPESDQDYGYGHTNVYEEIGRGQHTELKSAKKLGKLCITFSCISKEVLYILETLDSKKAKGNNYWGQGFAKLHSRHYGEYGAEFSDFVTGYMSTEMQIKHDYNTKRTCANSLLLLLLDN